MKGLNKIYCVEIKKGVLKHNGNFFHFYEGTKIKKGKKKTNSSFRKSSVKVSG